MRALASVALALVAAVFVSGAAADGGGRAESVAFGAGQLWTTVQDRLVSVDPVTGRSREIRTGVYGTAIAVTSRTAWRLQPHSLFGVNLSTRRVRVRLGFGHAAYALAAGYGAVWLPSFGSDTLTKVDGRTGMRRWQVRVAHSPEAVTTGDGSVWLASTGRWHKGRGDTMVPEGHGVVLRLDPMTGAVRARVLVDRGPTAIAFGAGDAWVLNGRGIGADDTLNRIDAGTNRVVASIRVPHWSSAVTVGRLYAWVVSEPKSAGGTITRIDLRTNHGITRPIPHSWIPQAVALASGGVWVADPGVAQLIRIDPHTLRVAKRVTFPVS